MLPAVLMRFLGRTVSGGGTGKPRARLRMQVEEIEPRILHSADPLTAALGDLSGAAVEMRVVEVKPSTSEQPVATQQAQRYELVIVDPTTPDYQILVDDIVSQSGGERRFTVLILDGARDGVAQISEALATMSDLDAIHMIGHGSDGLVGLGSGVLDARTMQERSAEVGAWGRALAAEGDLLIYGCDVAASADGRLFVDTLARLTGADVAASDDITGQAVKGGDWLLEYRAGTLESAVAVSASAQGSWQGILANAAPMLTGANNLTTIAEDPAADSGTLVSALIAGQVTDADVGALQGIAVTATDNANGTWQYTINGGVSWNAFGTPSAAAARLLAADANTSVRFVPNANWNGTVTNGLTFRAWDQTSGTAGGTADTTTLTSTVRDNFDAVSYTNNDGTATWAAGWVDTDANAAAGNILVNAGALELKTFLGSDFIYREANLTAATSATLSFTYDNNLTALLGTVTIQASANGGVSYTTLTSAPPTGIGTVSFDLTPYIAANTRIKFQMDGLALGGRYLADNIEISYVTPLNGGATAFSSATAASSITVSAVNDAPVGTANTVTTSEDTAFVFTTAAFGFTDPSDAPVNSLAAVKITTLASAGSLTLTGVAVTAGQTVSVADINAGNLRFTPAANANGAGYASFTFQVQDNGGTASGGVDLDTTARTMTVNVTAVQDAPVLAGANNLITINEDAATNAGTLVSALIAGQFSDPDAGALSGIAVTAVDNTNGAWQYSTNSGGSWSNFGSPSAGSARLLAADANTYVRFVPNGNWNGTVAGGLTFRAWDQTLGTNGGVAPTIPNPVLLDNFSTISYGNNDGTANWSANWVDTDADPVSGKIKITAGELELKKNAGAASIYRAADLTGATSATLSFSYRNLVGPADPGSYVVQVSGNGGSSYTTLGTFSGVSNTGSGSFSADISGFISAVTRVRFQSPVNAPQDFFVDNVQIALTAPGTGGSSAFSSAAAASSITVSSVNDAPVGTSSTVTTNEDTPHVFTTAGFGFSDASDSPANSLQAVKIVTLPAAGALRLGGVAVTAGQFVSAADIGAGNLVFTPAANANGAGYASFTFQVQDSGGTALGGVDLDPTARTMTVNVTSVNDAPVGTSNTVTTNEDTALTFTAAHFGFTDPSDSPANTLAGVKITTLASAGSLSLSGTAVTAGQTISVADVNAGNLRFTPAANANGTGYAAFTFQVQDSGGTASGGVDLDTTARTMTVNVTAVNDAPVGTSNTVTTNEDTVLTFTAAHFGFTDASDSPANSLTAVRITTLPGAGSLSLSGVAVTAGQTITVANINAGNLRFTPAANANGTGYAAFTFQVQDSGGTALGGVDLDTTARTMTVNVTSVNDAPVGTSNTVTTNEDTALTFTTAHFGFTDPSDSPVNSLAAVKIATLPGAGSLTLSGVAVTAGQSIAVADVNAGNLKFTPVANANGAGYASFTFQVQDSGGTSSGGVDLDTTARTMTVNVTAVNDAPVLAGANNLTTINEDTAANPGTLVSALVAGQVTDADFPAPLAGIAVIGVNNTNGTWQYSTNSGGSWLGFGSPSAGTARLLAADANTYVRFVPDANWNGTVASGLTFRAWDQTLGTNGGVAPTIPNPVLQDNFNTVSWSNNDGTAQWSSNWVDPDRNPAAGAIRIRGDLLEVGASSGLPSVYREADLTGATSATLSFSYDNDLNSGSSILAQISNDGGTSYTTIRTFSGSASTGSGSLSTDVSAFISATTRVRFQVTATSGGDLHIDTVRIALTAPGNGGSAAFSSATAASSITVNSVNDAPAGTNNTVTTNEDTPYVFTVAAFGLTDASDSPANSLQAVRIATLPGAGALRLSGVSVTAGERVSAVDIATGNLMFTPAANANGASYSSFTFQVQDSGGTALGGVDLDATARTMTVNVTAVNDAPVGTSSTVTTNEDTAFTFTAANFGFTDPSDTPANSLSGVRITTLASAGSLTLSGTAVTAGQTVSVANINAGNLRYTPAANANGAAAASFTFQVQDSGGTALGGVDLDATARTMTVNVTAVNDAPVGTSTTVTTNEDTALTFTAANFGFTDPSDTPANSLSGVKITTLASAGSLSLSGTAVTAGQTITVANINAGNLRYMPVANANGAAAASFTFQVQDSGGTALGGVDLDTTARTMTVNVTAVNDAPAGTNNTVGTLQDTPLVLTGAHFRFTDGSDTPANALAAVQIGALPAAGSLALNGVAVTAGQFVSAVDIAARSLVFTPGLGGSGLGYASLTFQVRDDGGTANGGADLDPVARTLTIDVGAINHAPVGTSVTPVMAEDSAYVFNVASFGYSDPDDGIPHNLQAVKISTVPAVGALMLNGAAVTAGQFVFAADVAAGRLIYTPAANANGTGYASFTFQVQDDGGTANGGTDLDQTARVFTFDVSAVNDAPVGTSNTVSTNEDTAFAFSSAHFGLADPSDSPANSLAGVKITTLATAGSLTLSGTAVSAGQTITVADINAGNLVFTPVANANGAGYASFTFQVQDDGGGANLDTTARTLTVNVTGVNDVPVGTSNTVTTNEDTVLIFNAAHFGFTDPSDSPANGLAGVNITTPATAGSLTLSGTVVTAGQSISVADINAGNLRFTPAANANGSGSAAFTFQVQDDGVGAELDTIARTMTVNVTSVNDAPVGTSNTVTTNEDTALTFSAAHFGYTDPSDSPANSLTGLKITTLATAGSLTLSGTAVSAGQTITVADIDAGNLVFTPVANANGAGYASFTFQVQDNGGGANLDPIARTMAVNVTSVNDAPTGASNTVSIAAGSAYVLGGRTFGFSDPADTPANGFTAVRIAALPSGGSLTLSGAAVTVGQRISLADINAGRLLFNLGDTATAAFTFQVQDDGGGADFDPTARTLTIQVAAPPRQEIAAPVEQPVTVVAAPMVTERVAAVTAPQPTSSTASGSASTAAPASSSPSSTAAIPPTAAAAAEAAEQKAEAAGESGSPSASGPAGGQLQGTAPEDFRSGATGATSGGAAGGVVQGQVQGPTQAQGQIGVQRADSVQIIKDARDASIGLPTDSQSLMQQSQGDISSFTSIALAMQVQSSSASELLATPESRALGQELDQLRDSLKDQTRLEAATVAATAATGMSLSVGYVVWLLRGGALLSTFLSSLPAWRFIDPLPVLGRIDDDEDDDDGDDSLESIVASDDANHRDAESGAPVLASDIAPDTAALAVPPGAEEALLASSLPFQPGAATSPPGVERPS